MVPFEQQSQQVERLLPFFELGKHTKQDLINMLDQYPNAHAVELKGERVLITASPARVKKYLLGSNTDPVQLLKKNG